MESTRMRRCAALKAPGDFLGCGVENLQSGDCADGFRRQSRPRGHCPSESEREGADRSDGACTGPDERLLAERRVAPEPPHASPPARTVKRAGRGQGGPGAGSMGWGPGWCLLLSLTFSGAAGTEPPAAGRRQQAVDIVLDCFLVTEDKRLGAFASSENREKALLVLRQVPVLGDGSLEGITEFQVTTDAPPVVFEASVDLVRIPAAEALLHADCSGKGVSCEIAHYFHQARQEATNERAAWFITNMHVSTGGPSVSMVMETVGDAESGVVWHSMPNLPLSPQGTVRTEVLLQVTTQTQAVSHLLGSSASLHCAFSTAPGLGLIGVEWRRQHRGTGQLLYSWQAGQGQAKREGATLEPEQLLKAGDATLTLPSLTLKDEGTYICQITTSLYQAQQVIQLNIRAPPKVRLSLANEALPPTLICHVTGYYPLDVVVTWIREELSGVPAQVSGASFSSLRQSMAGTYSISSTLTAEPGPIGATYICRVTHISLEEPLRASMRVVPHTEWRMAFGVILASSLFLLALLLLGLHRQQGLPRLPGILDRHSPASK